MLVIDWAGGTSAPLMFLSIGELHGYTTAA